jgi:cell division protein FtsB
MRQWRINRLVIPAICLAIAGYFGYHGLNARTSLDRLQAEAVTVKRELAVRRLQREALQHKTGLLRPGSLDPDMLDARARAAVNLAHPRDLVIFLPER